MATLGSILGVNSPRYNEALIYLHEDGMLGDVDTPAATGAVTDTDKLMAYQKQIVGLLRTLIEAGLTPFPAGAPAADGAVVAAVLRYAQEALRKSGGTGLADSKSILDALGVDGDSSLVHWSPGAGCIQGAPGNSMVAYTSLGGNSIPNNSQDLEIFATTGIVLVEGLRIDIDNVGWVGGAGPTSLILSTDEPFGLTGLANPIQVWTCREEAAGPVVLGGANSSLFGSFAPFILRGSSLYLCGDDAIGDLEGIGWITVWGRRLLAGSYIEQS